jgi:hypothetical protein
MWLHVYFDRDVPEAEQQATVNAVLSVPDLVKACKDVLTALQKSTQETGEILWLDHVLPGVHESAMERLQEVIAQAEGRPVSEIGWPMDRNPRDCRTITLR